MNILLNGTVIEELSTIVHCTKATQIGKRMCTKLLDIIPKQQFQIAIQAAVKGKILARETLKAYRKDVAAKLVRIMVLIFFFANYYLHSLIIYLLIFSMVET